VGVVGATAGGRVRSRVRVELIGIDVGIRHSLAVAGRHGGRLVGAELVDVGRSRPVVTDAHDEQLPSG
jgi:hypothetical protein